MKFRIREIDPRSEAEISWVASRMRQTLVEVLGHEKGTALYSMDWLLERVRWHLDPAQTTAKIFLLESDGVVGHAIARLEEKEDADSSYGYFSTLFVEPLFRRRGLASALMAKVEDWFTKMKLKRIVYNTAENHEQLIRLFERHGYRITHRAEDMVQLAKELG